MSLRTEFLGGGGCPIVDMHGHLGPFHGIYLPEEALDTMIEGMDRCGIEVIVLSPHAALIGDTREGNREMLDAVRRYPGRVYGYFTPNPNYPSDLEPEMDRYLAEPGVVGIKIHPSMHNVPVGDPRYEPVWERANREKLLVLSHTWGRTGDCGAREMRAVAERYPEVRLLLGHSCYGAWREVIALAHDCPNVYLELTAAGHVSGLIEWMCRDAGAEKVLYGTDYPWFDPAVYIGFVTFAQIDDAAMRKILFTNGRLLLDEQLARRT